MSVISIFNVFVSCSIDIIVLYLYGKIIFKNTNKKFSIKTALILFVCAILHTIIYLFLDGTLKTMLLCLMIAIMLKIIFNKKFSKSLLASIIYIIVLIIPDIIVLIFSTKVLGISNEVYYASFSGSIIGNLIVSALMIALILLLKKSIKKILETNISTTKKVTFISTLTIIFMLIFFYKFIIGYKTNENVLVYIIAMIAFAIVLFSLLKEKIENENMIKKYDELLNVMKSYEKDIEHQSKITHEIRNELMTIRSKIAEKNKDSDIIEYIDSILDDNISSDISKYAKFIYLPSNGLRGFFYYKSLEAEKKNINVSVNISKTLEKSFLNDLDTKDFKDLGRILGVYLDNAIDASEKSKDKQLGIEVYLIKKEIHTIITNTFINNIDLEKLGKERYTTKGKNHGHGLLLVNSILSGNNRFVSNSKVINNLYVQELIIREK